MIDQTWIDNSYLSTGDLVILVSVLAAPVIGWLLAVVKERRHRKQ